MTTFSGQLLMPNKPKRLHWPYRPSVTILLLLGLFLASGTLMLAQSPIRAEVDRTTLSTDEEVLLRVTVQSDNLNIPSPSLTGLRDFRVVGSSESKEFSMINGQITSQGVFIYRLSPLQTGELTIPAISVTVEGQTFQTEPILIEVLPGAQPLQPSAEDVPSAEAPGTLVGQNLFVEAEVDNTAPYLNQQITYIFRFYQAIDYPINFQGRLDYRAPAFTDFWNQTVLSQPHYTTEAAGRGYTVTEIRTALFPAGLNEITIEPARLVVPGGLLNPDIVLETEPVTIQVQSLPGNAPQAFNGAIGQFELRAFTDKTQGQVDDTLQLVLEIKGTGNIEAITEPALPDLPDWRLFESQASTTIEPRDDLVYGTRRFERLIVPGKPGDYTIPPISFSYYDPALEDYQTLETDPIEVSILPNGDELAETVAEADQTQLGPIRAIKPVPASISRLTSFSPISNVVYWACWIIPIFIVGGVWVFQTQRRRLMTDTAYARHLRARRVAQRILTETDQSHNDKYAIAQRALLGYLSDKLNQPTTGLTTGQLIDLLQKNQLDPALIERIRAVLGQIEVSRFAPVEEGADDSLIAETKQIINALEKVFRR